MTNANLLRKTVDVIRRYPVICVPVIWAAVLIWGFESLRMLFPRELVALMLKVHIGEGRSVLGGFDGTFNPGPVLNAFIYTSAGALSILCGYAAVCCHFIALMMSVRILARILLGDETVDQIPAKIFSKQLLGYSLLSYFLSAATVMLCSACYVYMASRIHISRMGIRYFGAASVLLIFPVLAYFVSPLALKLIARTYQRHVDKDDLKKARLFSLFAGVGIAAIAAGIFQAPKPWTSGFFQKAGLGVLTSLPYVPLFIVLGLLAMGDTVEEASGGDE